MGAGRDSPCQPPFLLMPTEQMPGAPEGGDESQGEDSFFLPADFLQGKDLQPGDKITLSVVAKDKDGDFEVKMDGEAKPEETGSITDDLAKSGAFPEEGV